MPTSPGRYRLRYSPVRDAHRSVTVEVGADSAAEVIRTIRRAEGWIYILSLEKLPPQKTSEQTSLHLAT